MAQAFEQSYVGTRRQLHGIAESLIAGPQHRSAGTIRLAVRPDGCAGTAVALAVRGAEFVWQGGAHALSGTPRALAAAAGVEIGPPEGVYPVEDPLPLELALEVDRCAVDLVQRSHHAGAQALNRVLPQEHPVLWPEHFDVAVSADEVGYGVSAGDDYHPMPYAYVGPWTPRNGSFWNAPFGALYPIDAESDVDALTGQIADFFDRGRTESSRSTE